MRLIDADALEYDTEWSEYHDGFTAYSQMAIDTAPTIDAVSVVRGEWKPFDQTWGREVWYCTACETSMHMPTEMGKPMYEYCPYCGAKMDGEREGE